MVVHRCRRAARYEHKVNIIRQCATMDAIDFPEISFDSVSRHRTADFARYGTPQLPSLARLPDCVTDKCPANPFPTLGIRTLKVFGMGEMFASREFVFARHSRLITFTLGHGIRSRLMLKGACGPLAADAVSRYAHSPSPCAKENHGCVSS